jgi:hypothetical protein
MEDTMELRELSEGHQRKEFAQNLVNTRMSKGAGFSETKRSMVGEVHLQFARLYGLYDEQSATPDEMLAGFAIHDLASFPQSYPRPDLSKFDPEHVYECGELWAKCPGAARIVRQGAFILVGEFRARAVLVYPIFKPWNLTFPYTSFVRIGEPIEWPYIRTLDGRRMLVQAMVCDGENLARSIAEAGQFGFQMLSESRCIRFNTPYQIFNGDREKRVRDRRRSGDEAVVQHAAA